MHSSITLAGTAPVEAAHSVLNDLILACSLLDITAVEALVSEDEVFEGQNKWLFLHSLQKEFDEVAEDGINQLEVGTGGCTCYSGTPKITFSHGGEVRFGLIIRVGSANAAMPVKGSFINGTLKYGDEAATITDIIICSPRVLFSTDPNEKTVFSRLKAKEDAARLQFPD